jgi:anti-sigma factor RsiW
MIDLDTKLKVQAYVDNELNPSESRAMAARLERDAEARALYAELKELRALVAGNELEFKLPESREFYWSKIQREIAQLSSEAERAERAPRPWWRRLLAPAAGFALLVAIAAPLLRSLQNTSELSAMHEIETPLEEISSISFHSQSAGMTVVWVQTGGY